MIRTYKKDTLNPDHNYEKDGTNFINTGFERLSNSPREVVMSAKG